MTLPLQCECPAPMTSSAVLPILLCLCHSSAVVLHDQAEVVFNGAFVKMEMKEPPSLVNIANNDLLNDNCGVVTGG